MRLTERPATVRRLADALYRHYVDFATGMGDPPAEHATDYPWVHPTFVKAWVRATGLTATAVPDSATPGASGVAPTPAPVAPVPAPVVPSRVSARIRKHAPADPPQPESKRPRTAASPAPTTSLSKSQAKQLNRVRRKEQAAKPAPVAPKARAKAPKASTTRKGKGKAKEPEPESDSEVAVVPTNVAAASATPGASSSKAAVPFVAVPVTKAAGSRRPRKRAVSAARGGPSAPRTRRVNLPSFSAPIYPPGAKIPQTPAERVSLIGRPPSSYTDHPAYSARTAAVTSLTARRCNASCARASAAAIAASTVARCATSANGSPLPPRTLARRPSPTLRGTRAMTLRSVSPRPCSVSPLFRSARSPYLLPAAARPIAREVFDQCHLRLHGHLTPDWAIAELTQELGHPPVYVPESDSESEVGDDGAPIAPPPATTVAPANDTPATASAPVAIDEAAASESGASSSGSSDEGSNAGAGDSDAEMRGSSPAPADAPPDAVAEPSSPRGYSPAFQDSGFVVGIAGSPPLSKQGRPPLSRRRAAALRLAYLSAHPPSVAPVADPTDPDVAPLGIMGEHEYMRHRELQKVRAQFLLPLLREFTEVFPFLFPQADTSGAAANDAAADTTTSRVAPQTGESSSGLPYSEEELRRHIEQESQTFREEFDQRFRRALAEDEFGAVSAPLGLSPTDAAFYHTLEQQRVLFMARARAYGAMAEGTSALVGGLIRQAREVVQAALDAAEAQLALPATTGVSADAVPPAAASSPLASTAVNEAAVPTPATAASPATPRSAPSPVADANAASAIPKAAQGTETV